MIQYEIRSVVMQPVTVCNLDCTYCYLPTRHLNLKMPPQVAARVADAIEKQDSDRSTLVIWHGGEALATGLKHFRLLVHSFEKLRESGKVNHSIQTNGTLINTSWCEFFQEYKFRVGVSIDGPEWANINRVDLTGKPMFPKIMKGISLLKQHRIPFGVIAVVHEANIERVEEFYDFFCDLGCDNLAINIEEIEGVNKKNSQIDDDRTYKFWKRLFNAWQRNPSLRTRELDSSLSYIDSVISNQERETGGLFENDSFPTIGWNGNVYLLSPEFGGYDDFVVGNLLEQTLSEILKIGRTAKYVVDFEKGVDTCRSECPYYLACRGGYASNKYFEHGTTNATETTFCRNARKRLLDAILDSV